MDQFSHGLQSKKLDSRKRYKSPTWIKVTVQHYPWQSTICSHVGFSVVLKVANPLTRSTIHRRKVQSRTLFPKNTTDPSWPPHPYGLVESLRPRLKPKDERTSTVPGESRRPVNLEMRETMQVRGLFFLKGDELPETARFQPSNDMVFLDTQNMWRYPHMEQGLYPRNVKRLLCLWKYRQNAIFPNTMDVSKIDFLLADGLDEMNLWSFPN